MTSQILANAGYSLYPHQVKGIEFMTNIEKTYTRGGILADEVGLGKTIQTIGLLLERPGHTLIAGPLGVVPQWAEKLRMLSRALPRAGGGGRRRVGGARHRAVTLTHQRG